MTTFTMKLKTNEKHQTPSSRHQTSTKLQIPGGSLRLLKIGIWSVIGAWTLILGAFTLNAAPATVRLKLGTLAPAGTTYHKSLQAMGEKWRKVSDGAVQVAIYPGGTQGSEADMVGLMQTGNLDAGLLTVTGLSEIEPTVTALHLMPMAFRNLDEVDYVGDKLVPQLNARLLAKGYVVLFWTDSGWVRFFSTQPVLHPDDLRKLKIFSWASQATQYDLYKSSGFTPVALETAGIPQALLSGTISAIPTVPIFALAAQMDHQAKYMLEVNWAPLVGAAVIRKKSWDKIPAATQNEMLKIAAETGRKVKADGRAESDAAVAAMVKRGLKVTKMTPDVEAEWRAILDKVQDQIRGKIVPTEVFDEAQRAVKEYRSGAGKSK
jgi:TRAP-type C4-dicarboxylate transport system substrate-binding protein